MKSCGAVADVRAVTLAARRSTSGSPAAKPERKPAIAERLESVLKHDDVRAVGDLQRRHRRLVAEVELAVGLVGGQHEVVLARQRGRPLVELERRLAPRSGCWGSSATARATRAQRRAGTASRSGRKPSARRSGSSSTCLPANSAPRSGHRVAGRRHGHEVAVEDLGELEDRLLGAERRDDLGVRVQRDAEAPRAPARRSRPAAPADPRPAGSASVGSIASAIASRMKAGVSSRGSPMPKSITSMPAAARRALGLGQPREGVGAADRSKVGESLTPRRRRPRGRGRQRTSAAISTDSSRRCAWAGAPGPKFTAGMPASGQLGHRGPGLLGRDLEVAGLAQRARPAGGWRRRLAARGVGVDPQLAVTAAQLEQVAPRPPRRDGPARSGS